MDMAANLACLDPMLCHVARGCASFLALLLVMICAWSLTLQRWHMCIAKIFHKDIRQWSKSCGSQMCCSLPDGPC